MQNIKLTLIILATLFMGCGNTESNNEATENEDSVEEVVQAEPEAQSDNSGEANAILGEQISSLVEMLRAGDADLIAARVDYPLNRETPIPSINDAAEFQRRFNEVFDQAFIDKILNSTADQWAQVGSKGIMFDNGALWLDGTSGNITAVNYQSEAEKQIKEGLIADQKQGLHASLATFESPLHKFKTETYLIRVDHLGDDKYRYASWKLAKSESSKPDLVLGNGVFEYQGSGGNHDITFTNGDYTYKVERNVLGADDTPDITLTVEEKGVVIWSEGGTLVND